MLWTANISLFPSGFGESPIEIQVRGGPTFGPVKYVKEVSQGCPRENDTTDEENVWDRIGSIFGGSTNRSGNDSVSEGDY